MSGADLEFGVRLSLLVMTTVVTIMTAQGVKNLLLGEESTEVGLLRTGLFFLTIGAFITNIVHISNLLSFDSRVHDLESLIMSGALAFIVTGYFFSIVAWAIAKTGQTIQSFIIVFIMTVLSAIVVSGAMFYNYLRLILSFINT